MSESRFQISYAPSLLPLFRGLGMGPAGAGIRLEGDSVRVRMGWAFRTTFPRSAVRSVALDDAAVTGWGVHGWRGRWLVNGTSAGLVRVEIDPAARASVIGVPIRLTTLRVSVTDPAGLIRALGQPG